MIEVNKNYRRWLDFSQNLPKTAVIGVTGFLGKAFFNAYRCIHKDCVGTSRKPAGYNNCFHLDILSPNIVPMRLAETGHKDALIFAAVSKLAVCEKEKGMAWKVNVEGTIQLIHQLVAEGIKPIFVSSDNVFDGSKGNYREDSPRNPITEYGRHKAEVENRIGEICGERFLVIRIGKIFDIVKGDGTILDEMASCFARGHIVRAAYDQVLNPTLVGDLIRVVALLQERDVCGIVNVCSEETWSRYDLALSVAKAMKLDTCQVKRISIDDLGILPGWSKNTSMATGLLKQKVQYGFTSVSRCIEIVASNWINS